MQQGTLLDVLKKKLRQTKAAQVHCSNQFNCKYLDLLCITDFMLILTEMGRFGSKRARICVTFIKLVTVMYDIGIGNKSIIKTITVSDTVILGKDENDSFERAIFTVI